MPPKDLAYNKRAHFDYDLIQTFEAGIKLLGVEVKSVRAGHMSLRGAFVTIHNSQPLLTNATIPPWQAANTPANYDPVRSRPLLLKTVEIKQLIGHKQTQGLTIIPVRVYNKRGKIKLAIALARGKKQFQKKDQKKAADIQRDVERLLRGKQ